MLNTKYEISPKRANISLADISIELSKILMLHVCSGVILQNNAIKTIDIVKQISNTPHSLRICFFICLFVMVSVCVLKYFVVVCKCKTKQQVYILYLAVAPTSCPTNSPFKYL